MHDRLRALEDPNNWWQYSRAHDALQAIDPVYGTPIDPNAHPKFMDDVPELKAGHEFWLRNGPNIRVTNLYVVHSTAADLASKTTSFEDAVKAFPFFGYESVGNNTLDTAQAKGEALNTMLRLHTLGRFSLDEYLEYSQQHGNCKKDNSYLQRLHRAFILSKTTNAFPIDARSDGTELERRFVAIDQSWESSQNTVEKQAFQATIMHRDWFMLDTLAIELEKHLGPIVKKPVEVATLMGTAHSDATRKLNECLGTAATGIKWGPAAHADPAISETSTQIARTGLMTDADRRFFGIIR